MKLIKYIIILFLLMFNALVYPKTIVYAEDFQFASVSTNFPTLTEENLKWVEITMKIPNTDSFKNPLNPGDIHFHNQPSGVSVESITRVDNQTVIMKLDYDWSDFDADKNDFLVDTGSGASVNGYTYGDWFLPIKAVVEPANSMKAFTDYPLTESNLNGAKIELVLASHDFEGTIPANGIVLNNAPAGLSIASVTRSPSNNRVAIVTLAYDKTDFDSDITNFNITALDPAHKGNYNVTSNNMLISAVVEPYASIAITSSPSKLYENSLDGAIVNFKLNSDSFKSSLSSNDIVLNNAPVGLTFSNVIYKSTTEAQITLNFNGTDFDEDYTDFNISVLSSGLTNAPSALSNSKVIRALKEIEGQENYIATGLSYPVLIEMTGYNSKSKKLYINSRLHTDKDVTNKTATFNYYIKVYDNNSNEIGALGDMNNPLVKVANLGESEIALNNIQISLNQDFPNAYRIVVIIVNVTTT